MGATDSPDLTPALGWAARRIGAVESVQDLTGGWTSTMLALGNAGGDQAVLRLMTQQPWRSHGPALTTREARVQEMLEGSDVPAPRSLALDADGAECGHSAHLMSRLPGFVDTDRVDRASLDRLARLLSDVHAFDPTTPMRNYESWAWEAKHVVPPWATDPGPWRAAFAVLGTAPPLHDECFIHRDFHLRNVLWVGGEVSGLVDWVETSTGPAWLDVARCCSNLAIAHGNEIADRFATAYVRRTGREPQPYFDLMDLVGFLPPPGKRLLSFLDGKPSRERFEKRLCVVLSRWGL